MTRIAKFPATLALALLLAPSPVVRAETTEAVATPSRVLVPFELVGTRAQRHLIAWFSGHPDWESVEAFDYGGGKIRAILTRRGGSQIDAFNYAHPDVSSGRDWYASGIALTIVNGGKDARLEMTTPDGKSLVLSFVGEGKPNTRYGGLTDPGNHSLDTGLPAMWRKASAVSGPESSLTIDGRTYEIPMDEKISRPPFFTAYSAFLSEDFESLFVRAYGTRSVTALARPDRDAANATGEGASVRLSYKTGVSTNVVTFFGHGEGYGIASIVSGTGESSGVGAGSATEGVELRFQPALADLASVPEGGASSSRFSIIFDGGRARAIEGTVTVARTDDRITMILRPEKPDWMRASRSIKYEIDLSRAEPIASATVLRGDREGAR